MLCLAHGRWRRLARPAPDSTVLASTYGSPEPKGCAALRAATLQGSRAMPEVTVADEAQIPLASAVRAIRAQLVEAVRAGKDEEIRFALGPVELELQVRGQPGG